MQLMRENKVLQSFKGLDKDRGKDLWFDAGPVKNVPRILAAALTGNLS